MKKIVPFKKDIIFKTNLSEITSISLEHTLHLENSLITGEFLLSGEYKMTDTSINTEKFAFNLPFDITLDERYIIDNVVVDIDDFYYEIVDSNVLQVNIDVLIDKLEEKLIEEIELKGEKKVINKIIDMDEERDNSSFVEEKVNDRDISKKEVEITKDEVVKINNIFDNLSDGETYATYKVYIVRENDTIESIIQKYSITKNQLEDYNDLKEIKIGDKIIIPTNVQV